MRLPFIRDDTKDGEKRKFHKVLQDEVWKITKLAMFRRLKVEHINKLEKMYKDYFIKYPNTKSEEDSKYRIEKLRKII